VISELLPLRPSFPCHKSRQIDCAIASYYSGYFSFQPESVEQ